METLSQNLVHELIRRLVAEFQPHQIWLFGSHAWGLPDEHSDIDVLVVVGESSESPVRRAQRAHRCLKGLGISKDILVKTQAEIDRFRGVPSSLESDILARGRRIYG
jgi:predicted nucleotidyltransferase